MVQNALDPSPTTSQTPKPNYNGSIAPLSSINHPHIRSNNGITFPKGDAQQVVEDDNGKSATDGCVAREKASEAVDIEKFNLFFGKSSHQSFSPMSSDLGHVIETRRCSSHEASCDQIGIRKIVKGLSSTSGFQIRSNGEKNGLKSFCFSESIGPDIGQHLKGSDSSVPHNCCNEYGTARLFPSFVPQRQHGIHVERSQGARKDDLSSFPTCAERRSDFGPTVSQPLALRYNRESTTTQVEPHDVNACPSTIGKIAAIVPYVKRSKEIVLFGTKMRVILNSNNLFLAASKMQIILDQIGDPALAEFDEVSFISIVPGGSDSTPTFLIFGLGGRMRLMRPRVVCCYPLAPIAKGGLNIRKVVAHLITSGEDSILLYLIRKFILATIEDDGHAVPEVADHKEIYPSLKTFYNFTIEDVSVLRNADLITDLKESTQSNPAFKVAKKDRTGRFIMDCRGLNSRYKSEGKQCPMDIDPLEEVIRAGEKYPICISTDADAFFFQFRLSNKAAKRFPVHFGLQRGKVLHFLFHALPMGFTLAPAIAQRTSNIIIRAVRRWIDQQSINGAVFAWIDNYLVFADDTKVAESIMNKMRYWLNFFEIKHKPVDYSGEFLGLLTSPAGVTLSSKFIEKTKSAMSTFKGIAHPSFNDFLIVAGHTIWANTTVIRQPLCMFPHTLNAIRLAAKGLESPIANPLLKQILAEMNKWESMLGTISKRSEVKNVERAWSDATPSSAAFVIEQGDHDFVAQAYFDPPLRPTEIFVAELIAATWALCSHNHVDGVIDNSAAAYAIAKGHSTAATANALIRLIYAHKRPRRIIKISTDEQRADGPTREREPAPRQDSYVSEEPLQSFFTA